MSFLEEDSEEDCEEVEAERATSRKGTADSSLALCCCLLLLLLMLLVRLRPAARRRSQSDD